LIREPLALDPFERALGAAGIVNAKGFPIVVREIELCEKKEDRARGWRHHSRR
jgi:hypothetical protein